MNDIYRKKYMKYVQKNISLQQGGNLSQINVNAIKLDSTENNEMRILARLLKQLLKEYEFLLKTFGDYHGEEPTLNFDVNNITSDQKLANIVNIIGRLSKYNDHDIYPKINVDELKFIQNIFNFKLGHVGYQNINIPKLTKCNNFDKVSFRKYLPAMYDSRNFSIYVLINKLLGITNLDDMTLFYFVLNGNFGGHIFTIDHINGELHDVELISIQSGLQLLINNNCNEHITKGISEKLISNILERQKNCTQYYAYAWKNMSQILIAKYNFVSVCISGELYEITFCDDHKTYVLLFDNRDHFNLLFDPMTAHTNFEMITTVNNEHDYRFTFKLCDDNTLNLQFARNLILHKKLAIDVIEK